MWRQVVGKVYRTDDTPWTNTTVTFRRCTGSFTTTTQYPPDTLRFQTNSNGELVDCKLWVNETGDKISTYECTVGKDKFKFSLPVGNGSPIELSVLRAGSLPVDEYPQSIIHYIDNAISGIQSGSSQIYSNNIIASANLSAGRVVNLQTGNYAQLNEISGCFGLTTTSVNLGKSFKALVYGSYQSSVSYEINKKLYLADNGFITQLLNLESNIVEIGKVISTQNIFINCCCEVINVS